MNYKNCTELSESARLNMSQQTSPPQKSFMSVFTQHIYVM